MDVTEALDATEKYTDNVASASANYADRRSRHLSYLVRAFSYVYMAREWWFRRQSPTVTVLAGASSAIMPAGFLDVGYKGGIYLNSTGRRLDYISPQELTDVRQGPSPLVTDTPTFYSIFGLDVGEETDPIYSATLQIPKTISALTFTAWQDDEPPTLDENQNINNLKVLPERWHELVLIPAVRAIAQESKADPRYRTFLEDPTFQAGFNLMCIREKHGKDTPAQAPSFFGREY